MVGAVVFVVGENHGEFAKGVVNIYLATARLLWSLVTRERDGRKNKRKQRQRMAVFAAKVRRVREGKRRKKQEGKYAVK